MRLALKLLLFAPLALLVVGVNYAVDPGNAFGSEQRERRLATRLLAGRDVPASFALDELRLQRDLAEGRREAPEILVLGSSRAMMVGSAAFPGRAVVNASVSSASLEDAIALFELYEEHGLRPRTLLLGIDPWALNGSTRNPSSSLDPELQAGLRRLGRAAPAAYGALPALGGGRLARWLRLLSPSYFQASLAVWLRGGRPERGDPAREPAPARGAAEDPAVLHPDGSRTWAPRLDDTPVEAARAYAATQGASGLSFLKIPPDPDRVALLGAFVDHVGTLGVRVVIWLAPYHPAAYANLVAGHRAAAVMEGERAVRALAQPRHLVVLGSYDPAASGAREEDIADHHHLRWRQGNALIARLWVAAGL